MKKITRKDKKREERIVEEVIVDAYTPDEQAMGWYYYLEEKIDFPIVATCKVERSISPLQKGEEVEIIGMAPEEECEHEMFVCIRWSKKEFAVPLMQLKPSSQTDDVSREAIEDWLYWVAQGYKL